MAAYGLSTHIASNKFRSMLLLAGLFVLIYVLVYRRADLRVVIQRRVGHSLPGGGIARPGEGVSLCDRSSSALDRDRIFLPSVDDRRRHRREDVTGSGSPGSTISWKISASRAASRCRSSRWWTARH
jgi:hypothetical protein